MGLLAEGIIKVRHRNQLKILGGLYSGHSFFLEGFVLQLSDPLVEVVRLLE